MHGASAAWPLADRVSEAGLMSLGVACAAVAASPFVAVPVLLVAGVDLDRVPLPQVALVVLVVLLAVSFAVVFAAYTVSPRERIVAGERVLAHGDRDDSGVDVHRLSRIELLGGPRDRWLVLTQRAEPGPGGPAPVLRASLAVVASNPQLWGLVHRGLAHSVANGAVADDSTRQILGLPDGT